MKTTLYKPLYEIFSGTDYDIAEKIQRRRLQMLVHSYLYYSEDMNLIDDHTFDAWGAELAKLQEQYPDIANQVPWADAFVGWDGSTGAFLPYKDPQVVNIANRLIGVRSERQIKIPDKPKIITKNPARKKLF